MELDLQIILMGQGVDQYQSWAMEMVGKYPGFVGLEMGYNEPLAHQIQAGADILLMPSRYEPCGLDQLYALKYGTIPIVRAVGGLEDTVEDYDPQTTREPGLNSGNMNGKNCFKPYSGPYRSIGTSPAGIA